MCLFCVFFNTPLYSQDTLLTSYTIQEGLSGNGITDIYQDSNGFIWIGTQDGLNRYDGYTFKVFRHQVGNLNSISGNYITCIKEDINGDIWIGTLGDGLNKLNPLTEKFTTYNSVSSSSLVLPEDKVYGLATNTDSSIWIKTENYLVNYDIQNDIADLHSQYNNVFKNHDIIRIPFFSMSSDLLWIGTKAGLIQFNKKEGLNERIDFENATYGSDLLSGAISSIIKLSDKSIFVGGEQGASQLFLKENGQVFVKGIGLPVSRESVINCALFNNGENIWLGTNSGLRCLEYNNIKDEVSFNEEYFLNEDKNIIPGYEITALFKDRSGLLWVGTKYDGLIKVDFKLKKFRVVEKQGIIGNDIKSLLIDDEDRIWLGTASEGIKLYEQSKDIVFNYPVNKDLYALKEDAVLSMKLDSKGIFWIGTHNGVFVLNKRTKVVNKFNYLNRSEYKVLLEDNKINAIEEDVEGNIWFGTQFGLYQYNGSDIISFFSDKNDDGSICSDEVNALHQDKDGILWIGTTFGINFIDIKKNTENGFEQLQNWGDTISVLSSNCILSITEDRNNKIWFGTRSGATYYDKNKNRFAFFTQQDGLFNDKVNSIISDPNSGVWLGTNRGISLINKDNEIHNFTISDGLPGYVFNKGSVALSKQGKLYFGGVNGLTSIVPDSIKQNVHKPKVVLTSIELFHKRKLIKTFKGYKDKISLKYKKSSMLRVKFAALEYTDPSRNRFQVYLEGFDDDWQSVSYEPKIDFPDLPAGEYTLYVRGTNNDYVWSDEPVKLKIKIVAPIWMSNYAYAFYLIALIFLIQSIINYRIRHYKKAYKSMEESAVDKDKIEAQRELLSKINKSLTDSIFYAKRIQESILPSEGIVKEAFQDSFVYFRPKDLVSGDFYWLHEADGLIYIAAVDCTGHGVPGAFMSIIAYDMLQSIVGSGVQSCPATILDELSKEIINTFRKDKQGSDTGQYTVNDGMDISLCVVDVANRKMSYAGAFNPLYLVRNNEVFEYKADRYPIGYKSEDGFSYSKHEIAIEPNDAYYIFSDGYADQFGGTDGKKFKYRRFRHLLLNIHKLPAEDQKAILHQKLDEWMGEHEQVDDIIVIGFKPIVELI